MTVKIMNQIKFVLFMTLTLLLTISGFASAAFADTNLIANPGFEDGSTYPLNWGFVTVNGNTPKWDTISHTGLRSIKISIPGTNNIRGGYLQSAMIKVEPLQNYAFSVWGKTEGMGSTYTAVRVVEADVNRNWLKDTEIRFSSGTYDWIQKTLDFKTDSNTAYIYVEAIIQSGYGNFWVDDENLVLKTTSTPTPTSTVTNLVANPGFEDGNTYPLNWGFAPVNGNTPKWDTISHTGLRSIKISIPGTNNIRGGYLQSAMIKVEPLQNYAFSVRGKTEGMGGTYTAVRVVEADVNRNWVKDTEIRFSSGTYDWIQKTLDFKTDSNTAYIYVEAIIQSGYGNVWIDDVMLTPQSTIITSTPVSIQAPSSLGKIYYVAKNGNDNNLGTELSPWLTIQKAANKAVAGDTVYVKAGTYIEEVTFQNSGYAGNYITFQNYSTDVVNIKSPIKTYHNWMEVTPNHHSGTFEILGKSYIKIKGFVFVGQNTLYAPYAVISAELGAHHIIIDGNRFENFDPGQAFKGGSFNVGSDPYAAWNLDFINNYLTRNIIIPEGYNEVVSMARVNNANISYNTFANIEGMAIDYKEGSANGIISNNKISNVYIHKSDNKWTGYLAPAIYIDGYQIGINNVKVYNNFVKTASGIGVGSECGGLVQNVIFYNNILIGGYEGFNVPNWNNPSGECPGKIPKYKDLSFINNLAYNSNNAWFRIQPTQTDIILRNNIGYGTGYNYIPAGNTQDYNSWNLGITNPQFVNVAANDFHLQSNSPAIDVGSSTLAPSIDFDGNSRPKSGGYDLGAFEK